MFPILNINRIYAILLRIQAPFAVSWAQSKNVSCEEFMASGFNADLIIC